jgi:hypothetical protein
MATPAQRVNPQLLPQVRVEVDVDPFYTELMVQRVMEVLSGPNLENFLQTQAFPHFQDEIVQRFAHQGDRKSGHWPDLSDATQNIRSQEGFGPDWPVNIRTEEMFNEVTESADFSAGMASAEMMLPGRGLHGPVVEKLATAQLGKSGNKMSANFGPTPPRPVLAVDETDLEVLLERLNGFIITGVVGGLV